uniref:Uncharacterized protein n=1 Tax=Tetraselmis sp. GSL018 TaxID=582737 RepID=A0A061RCZ6_9CHLO|eukprot:CAMPEP_0177592050 /NCGR_PEP_ID=MMETSP0419_2-20121207/8342_1 /TAXON_ID=582737 /ORGANISM="Tetraselmis sp., Strain GSL018" /LENGTH=408 /DNA_ID=CAMNT_0019082869 /DNA_START=213 /DNA_END=1439 /DNA_ORIENTATION=+
MLLKTKLFTFFTLLFELETTAVWPVPEDVVSVATRDTELQLSTQRNGKATGASVGISLPIGYPLTPKNLGNTLRDVATKDFEVILTVVSLSEVIREAESWIDEVHNFLAHLADHGRAHNVLLVGANARTCEMLHPRGVPCYEDRHSTGWVRSADVENAHGRAPALKWWFGAAALKLGFHLLYMDAHAIALGDVLGDWPHEPGGYDVQGISAVDNSPHQRKYKQVEKACPFLSNMPGGAAAQAAVPCMSTAVFYASAGPATQALFDGMVTMITKHPEQWEMRLFQQVVVSYMIGEGESPVLKFRLLDVEKFSLYSVHALRKRMKLPVKPVIVYVGHLAPGQQHDAKVKLGVWKPHAWDRGSVGRARAADLATRLIQNATEHKSVWLAAMQAPFGGHVYVNDTVIGFHGP